jgi:hypothetical protein
MLRDAPRQEADRAVVAPFQDRAGRCIRRRNAGCRIGHDDEPSRSPDKGRSCAGASLAILRELVDRQGVDEFVRDRDDRSVGTSSMRSCHDAVVPSIACCLARSAGLVSTRWHRNGGAEIRDGARRAQRVRRQRAAAGTELDQVHAPGAPIWRQRSRPSADQLAEHLADLGRGREIARRAERSRVT